MGKVPHLLVHLFKWLPVSLIRVASRVMVLWNVGAIIVTAKARLQLVFLYK